MRNISQIIRRDLSGLFKNVMSIVITVGLVVLPSIFSWYNILACWDVFNNTGNLSVAVANEDEGFTSDLVTTDLNIGDKVVAALRGNDQINWVFTDGDDAVEGAKSGKYYASIVIPSNFSQKMLTFYEGDSASAEIDYYVNKKKNAIAPNITGAGADTVSYEINAAFAETVSKISVSLVKALVKGADDNDLGSQVKILSSHVRNVANRVDKTADLLGSYASLGEESEKLIDSSEVLFKLLDEQAGEAKSAIEEDKYKLHDLATSLKDEVKKLSAPLNNIEGSLDSLNEKVDSLLDETSSEASSLANILRKSASKFDKQANELKPIKRELERLREILQSLISKIIDDAEASGRSDPAIHSQIEDIFENIVVLDKAIALLDETIGSLQDASQSAKSAAHDLETGSENAKEEVAELRDLVGDAKKEIKNARQKLTTDLMPGLKKLERDVKGLESDLSAAVEKLKNLSDIPGLLNTTSHVVGDANQKISVAETKLRNASDRMRELAHAINTALASDDIDTLRSLLEENTDNLASALSAPVKVKRQAIFPSDGFGPAMTPLYCTLGIFIGSLLIMVAIKPEVSKRGKEILKNPKPRELYFGRFGVIALISLMQTTLLVLGNLFFLKVPVSDPFLFVLSFWISGLVFAFIIYTLVVAFGNLGKAVAVLLLIIQVTACGGSYPLDILPNFVQVISSWVPATYVVNAMRAAMMGVYQNDYWIAMGTLLLFVIPFLGLGLFLRKPLDRLMKAYVRKVEECKIMG